MEEARGCVRTHADDGPRATACTPVVTACLTPLAYTKSTIYCDTRKREQIVRERGIIPSVKKRRKAPHPLGPSLKERGTLHPFSEREEEGAPPPHPFSEREQSLLL